MLTWEDERWFSRFAQPTMNVWTVDGKSVALLQQDKSKDDPEPKAVACFGALDHEIGKVHLRFSNGQPNSTCTLEFIGYLLSVAEQRKKWVLVVIWDKAIWPVVLRRVRGWLEPYCMLMRYWRAWSDRPPPEALQALLEWLWNGNGFYLYAL